MASFHAIGTDCAEVFKVSPYPSGPSLSHLPPAIQLGPMQLIPNAVQIEPAILNSEYFGSPVRDSELEMCFGFSFDDIGLETCFASAPPIPSSKRMSCSSFGHPKLEMCFGVSFCESEIEMCFRSSWNGYELGVCSIFPQVLNSKCFWFCFRRLQVRKVFRLLFRRF